MRGKLLTHVGERKAEMRERDRKPTSLDLHWAYGRVGAEKRGPAPSLVDNCKLSLLFSRKISFKAMPKLTEYKVRM